MFILRFQSTLPSQGATCTAVTSVSRHIYFNPRSPHRERHKEEITNIISNFISIHAPLTGSDVDMLKPSDIGHISIHAPLTGSDSEWLSAGADLEISIHAPLTGSDEYDGLDCLKSLISIHAPLTGSDIYIFIARIRIQNFNPRSPHRERPYLIGLQYEKYIFQSTLPSQGATNSSTVATRSWIFQSTLPSQGAT